MKSRELGTSGIRVSVVGLGCNNFGFFQDAAQATACVHGALDAGITFFDMASEHGEGREEELVGAALGPRRREVVIATKVGQRELVRLAADGSMQFGTDASREGLSRRWILQSVEESLRRLGTDYIDLYQLHASDDRVPLEETLEALDRLVRQGKVRAIGSASTFATAADIARLHQAAIAGGWAPVVSMQSHYNLLVRDAEAEVLPTLREHRMSLLPFWPLANGLLTGKYAPGATPAADTRFARIPMVNDLYGPEHRRRIEAIRAVAAARGIPMGRLALAWLLAEPAVASVIAGASTPEQVAQNASAADAVLFADDRTELDRLTR